MVRCRVFGHRFRFAADGPTMRWECTRGCGAGGEKHYASVADAQRYAAALDKEDRTTIGKRAPLIAGVPLRLYRAIKDQRGPR